MYPYGPAAHRGSQDEAGKRSPRLNWGEKRGKGHLGVGKQGDRAPSSIPEGATCAHSVSSQVCRSRLGNCEQQLGLLVPLWALSRRRGASKLPKRPLVFESTAGRSRQGASRTQARLAVWRLADQGLRLWPRRTAQAPPPAAHNQELGLGVPRRGAQAESEPGPQMTILAGLPATWRARVARWSRPRACAPLHPPASSVCTGRPHPCPAPPPSWQEGAGGGRAEGWVADTERRAPGRVPAPAAPQ